MADKPPKGTASVEFRDPSWPAGLYRRGRWYHYRRMVDGRRKSQPLGTRTLGIAN